MTKNEIVQPSKYEEAVPMNNDGKMFIFYCPHPGKTRLLHILMCNVRYQNCEWSKDIALNVKIQ